MKAPSHIRRFRRALTRIKANLSAYIANREYHAADVDRLPGVRRYLGGLMNRSAARKRGKISRDLTLLARYAAAESPDASLLACYLRRAVRATLAECGHFPRDAEWPGQRHHSRALDLIEYIRRYIRGHML